MEGSFRDAMGGGGHRINWSVGQVVGRRGDGMGPVWRCRGPAGGGMVLRSAKQALGNGAAAPSCSYYASLRCTGG